MPQIQLTEKDNHLPRGCCAHGMSWSEQCSASAGDSSVLHVRKLRLTDLARQPRWSGPVPVLACWSPWSVSILKEINPEFSLEGLIVKLKLQHFGAFFIRKDPDAGED